MPCKIFEAKNDNSNGPFPQGFTVVSQLSQGFTALDTSQLPPSDYRLIDFGDGRKLEKVGNVVFDRPCPGAIEPRRGSDLWLKSGMSFDSPQNQGWHYRNSCSDGLEGWRCDCDPIRMILKPTVTGQIGIFPEHWAHWQWLSERLGAVRMRNEMTGESRIRVLNLFAYTGATSLFLASLDAEVTHVDASKPTVEWAKQNAIVSGLSESHIRWIVDDAVAFVRREIRRGRHYEAILLDPPTYGHGPQGKRWEIHRDLANLLIDCWHLLSERRCAVLLCGHSSHIRIHDLNDRIRQTLGAKAIHDCRVEKSFLESQDGRRLDCGFAAKYSW